MREQTVGDGKGYSTISRWTGRNWLSTNYRQNGPSTLDRVYNDDRTAGSGKHHSSNPWQHYHGIAAALSFIGVGYGILAIIIYTTGGSW